MSGCHVWTAGKNQKGYAVLWSQMEADGDYARTMHPGVGIAVADWLDLVGAWRDEGLGLIPPYSNIGDVWADIERQAHSLADLILGDAS